MSNLDTDIRTPLLVNFISQSGAIVNMTSPCSATYEAPDITKKVDCYPRETELCTHEGTEWAVHTRVYYTDEDFLENERYVPTKEQALRAVRRTVDRWIDE